MLSPDFVRNLLDDPSLTEEQIENIRATSHAFAELLLLAWRNGDFEKEDSSKRGS
jgi:hypothetical protein